MPRNSLSDFPEGGGLINKCKQSPTHNFYGNTSNDFDLVFQGSVNDLSNIASRAVAFVRERHPWLSPAGKWVRVYGFADGMAMVIESDDNFQSWEDAHVIPDQ